MEYYIELINQFIAHNLLEENCKKSLLRIINYSIELSRIYHCNERIIITSTIASYINLVHTRDSSDNKNITEQSDLINILKQNSFSLEEILEISSIQNNLQSIPSDKLSIIEKIVTDSIKLFEIDTHGFILNLNNSPIQIDPQSIFYRLQNELNKLSLIESKRYITSENMKNVFIKHIFDKDNEINKFYYPGKYIVLEGNSGVGKDTQAKSLKKYFEKQNKDVEIITEPTEFFRKIEKGESSNDELISKHKVFRKYAIIGDRLEQAEKSIKSNLERGKYIISVRNYLSMLVYQCETLDELIYINFLHSFLPIPDLIILYYTSPEVSYERVKKRTGLTYFDKYENLVKYNKKYEEIIKMGLLQCPIIEIDATESEEVVSNNTIKQIQELFGKMGNL